MALDQAVAALVLGPPLTCLDTCRHQVVVAVEVTKQIAHRPARHAAACPTLSDHALSPKVAWCPLRARIHLTWQPALAGSLVVAHVAAPRHGDPRARRRAAEKSGVGPGELSKRLLK